MQRQHKAKQREKMLPQISSQIKWDTWCAPQTHQCSRTPQIHLLFYSSLVFIGLSFCNIVSAWSFLVWPTVSLSCFSGKTLALRFHALFSVSPFASQDSGVQFQNCCLFSSLFMYPPSLLLELFFLVPFFFCQDSLHLWILFHVVPFYNYSFPSSIAFACLLHYFWEPPLFVRLGVLPSVSGWRDTLCVDPFDRCSSL